MGPMLWPALLGVLAVILLVVRVAAVFRFADARGNATTAVAFAPPRALTPILAVALLPGARRAAGVPGEMLDLAVKGVWKLGVVDPDARKADRRWFVVRPSLERPALEEEASRVVYDAVFPVGDPLQRRDLTPDAERTAVLAAALHTAEATVVRRGWVERWRETTSHRLVSLGSAGVSLASFLALLNVPAEGGGVQLWFLLPAALGMVTAWLRPRPRRLTAEGRRLTDELDGLRLYMTMAESDRLKVLQAPDTAELLPSVGGAGDTGAVARLHERLLGYAVVFGILPQWSEVVATEYEQADLAPLWLALPGYDLATALTWAAVMDAGGIGFVGDSLTDFGTGSGAEGLGMGELTGGGDGSASGGDSGFGDGGGGGGFGDGGGGFGDGGGFVGGGDFGGF